MVVAAVLLLVPFGVLAASPAAASDICHDAVTDNAHALTSSQLNFKGTAQLFRNAGAEVHVVTFEGTDVLKTFMGSKLAGCKNWQGPNGQAKSNLLVFFLNAHTRDVGVLFGSHWAPAFQDSGNYTRYWGSPLSNRYGKQGFGALFESRVTQTYTAIIPGNPHNGLAPPSTDWWQVALRAIAVVVLVCIMVLFILLLHGRDNKRSNGAHATT